jgi:hypothetical protein
VVSRRSVIICRSISVAIAVNVGSDMI